MKILTKPLLAVLLFALIQMLTGVVLFLLFKSPSAQALACSMIIADVLAVLACWKGLGMINWHEAFHPHIGPKAGIGIFAAAVGIICANLLNEQLGVPDLSTDSIMNLVNTPSGILLVALLGPITEELIFRHAIQGHLLRCNTSPWYAILISAALFGLIHFNPAQIVAGMAIGVILGVLYCRTGNILLPCIVHICNNTCSVLQIHLLGEQAADFTLTEWIGGTLNAWILIVFGTIICVWMLRFFWKGYENKY